MTDYGLLVEVIRIWNQAYPLSVFPEPPRGEHGSTIDTCSARMGRHVIGRLMEIIEECEDQEGGGLPT